MVLLPCSLPSQSFIKEIEFPNNDSTFRDPFFAESGSLHIVDKDNFMVAIPTIRTTDLISYNDGQFRGYMIRDIGFFSKFRFQSYANYHVFSGHRLIVMDIVTNNTWAKTGAISSPYISKPDAIMFTQSHRRANPRLNNTFSIHKISLEDGDGIWSFEYTKPSDTQDSTYTAAVKGGFSDGSFFLNFSGLNKSGILKLSEDGEIINQKIIQNDSISLGIEGMDDFENIYLKGSVQNGSNSKNERDAIIAKFDTDFNLIWSKRLCAENFNLDGLDLSVFPNGEVVFAYNTRGNLPVISGKLDTNGNLLNTNGYSFYQPLLGVGQDSSIFFLTSKKYFENGTSEDAFIIAKTDANGKIADCTQFDACLTVSDIDIQFTEWNWDWKRDTFFNNLRDTTIRIDSLEFQLTDHCGTPRPPTPYFFTPDTICQNECLRPDSLYNHLAHAVEWTITGDGVLFENQDTSFNYCFNQPGKYQIEQEVWLLGCSEFFTREVVVLHDSLGDLLGDDQLICDDSIATLSVDASRPIQNFQWNDGSDASALTISESGNYAVTVSDGFCTESDTIEITFFDEKYNGTILEVPTDSVICEQLLPIILTPQSDFSNEFFLNGNADARSSFEIKSGGSYQISTKIEDCEFSETFNLNLVPCEVDIYIPSSFSPNNDGINDLLAPLGNDFVGQKMQVFDRWGGLLFETQEAPFAWNGNEAEEGVYVVTFSYLNLKNQQEEVVSADVLVVR